MANDDLFNNLIGSVPPQPAPVPQQQPVPQPAPQQAPVQGARVSKPVSQPVAGSSILTMQSDGSTAQNLAILSNIQPVYTEAEWDKKYNLYINECSKIQVDVTNLTSSEITIAGGRISALLTPIRVDNANIQGNQLKYDMMLKTAKQIAYKFVTDDFNSKGLKQPTVNDHEAIATSIIAGDKKYENGMSLFELTETYAKRALQVKSIVDILQDKQSLLITYAAALKVETNLSNMSPSVPTDRQINQMRM